MKYEEKNYYPFFILEDTKITSKLFFECFHWDILVVPFAFVLVSISLIQGWRVKGTLSIKKNTRVVSPEVEFCDLRNAKKVLKPKILYDYRSFGKIH